MVVERKTTSMQEQLRVYIEAGLRDATNQPDAPALTFTKGNRAVAVRIFEEAGLDFFDDLNVQGEVVSRYMTSKDEGHRTFGYQIFCDDRTGDEGFYVFVRKKKSDAADRFEPTTVGGIEHPGPDLVRELILNLPRARHLYGKEFIDGLNRTIEKHLAGCVDCSRIPFEVVKDY